MRSGRLADGCEPIDMGTGEPAPRRRGEGEAGRYCSASRRGWRGAPAHDGQTIFFSQRSKPGPRVAVGCRQDRQRKGRGLSGLRARGRPNAGPRISTLEESSEVLRRIATGGWGAARPPGINT